MNAEHAENANAAKTSNRNNQWRAPVSVAGRGRVAGLVDEVGNASHEIDAVEYARFARWKDLVSAMNRSAAERKEINALWKDRRRLQAENRDLSPRDTARLSELLNEREIAEIEKAEKEQEHPYQERIDEVLSDRLGRDLVWQAIHEPKKLLARITRTSNRKNQLPSLTQDSAAKSYERLSVIFWRIGTELAAASPEGWAEELLANPDLTLLRLEAFVKGCAQLRGEAPRGAKIERELVTLEEAPLVHAEAKRRKITVAAVRHEVQRNCGFTGTENAADKFAKQVLKRANKRKVKHDLRRKST